MIIVLGSLSEPMVAGVFDILRSRGRLVAHVSPSDLPGAVRLSLSLPGREAWFLRSDGTRLALHEARSVYHRLGVVDFQQYAHQSDDESRFTNTECLAALNPALSLLPGLVVNRPVALATLACGPYRLAAIQQNGLRVPESIVTNDLDQAVAFFERHDGQIITTSISYLRPERIVPDRSRLLGGPWPVLLQQAVGGDQVKAHVVGTQVLSSAPLQAETQKRCIALARALGLTVATLDLKVPSDDAPWCLDVNPCPDFSPYEPSGRQPLLLAALCDLLEASDVAHTRA